MANISALGSAPVSFLDANGKQYFIPLAWISYTSATGSPAVAPLWPGWGTTAASAQKSAVATWVGLLATEGFINPAPVPPALPAFTITAHAVGATGNDITISLNSQNPDGSLNVTVSTTQIYTGLNYDPAKTNSIEELLGTNATNGTQPGLAYVGTKLTAVPAAAGATKFTQPGAGKPFQFLLGTGGVLLPTNSPTDNDAGLITATIANVVGDTFDLTLAWSKTVTNVTPATLGSSFAYLITVKAPASGFGSTPAVPSTVTLVGGANASSNPAIAASATVISS
jgi:hypothetical protein